MVKKHQEISKKVTQRVPFDEALRRLVNAPPPKRKKPKSDNRKSERK